MLRRRVFHGRPLEALEGMGFYGLLALKKEADTKPG